jgi:MarR family transcriptional regulator for hemolysin
MILGNTAMLQYDFDQSVAYWVVMTAKAFERALSAELLPYGITFRQWQVLAWLALEGQLTQVALAERMAIEPPTLVGILDRMQKAGWIARHGCPADRRKKLVTPTAQARPVWAKVAACARRVRKRAARGLYGGQLRNLKTTLSQIQRNLGTASMAPASRNGSHAQARGA